MHGLWRQEEQASSLIRSYSPQQRDSARFVESLRAELREAEFECHDQRRVNQEPRAELVTDLRRCEHDRAMLDAQNQMLLQRSAKQSEEILRVRMELNRRESELRRASPAVGLGGFDSAPRETTSFGWSDRPAHRDDFRSVDSFDDRSRASDHAGATPMRGGGVIASPILPPPSSAAWCHFGQADEEGKERAEDAAQNTERGSFENVASQRECCSCRSISLR